MNEYHEGKAHSISPQHTYLQPPFHHVVGHRATASEITMLLVRSSLRFLFSPTDQSADMNHMVIR